MLESKLKACFKACLKACMKAYVEGSVRNPWIILEIHAQPRALRGLRRRLAHFASGSFLRWGSNLINA